MAIATPATSIAELQGWAKWLGRFFTVVAALMTFYVGWQLGGESKFACILIGSGLAAITVGVSILLNFVEIANRAGATGIARGVFAFWAICVAAEYFTHTAFNVGHRAQNVDTATMQTTKYDDVRSQLSEEANKRTFLEKRLADLQEGKGAGSGWVSTKPVAAWQAEIGNMEGDRIYKRSKQCANVTIPESRAFCDKLTAARANLAAAAEMQTIQDQLALTEKALKETRTASAGTKKGESVAFEQTKMVASLATFDLAPSAAAIAWANMGIGAFLSLIFSFAATVFNFLGFRDWSDSMGSLAVKYADRNAKASAAQAQSLNAQPMPAKTKGDTYLNIADDARLDRIAQRLAAI